MHWPGHKLALTLASLVLLVWVAAMATSLRIAALPAQATGTMLVVFTPGTEREEAFSQLIAAGANPLRRTWLGFVWVVNGTEPGLAGRLVQQGALGAYEDLPVSPELSGCFAYADAKMAEIFSLH
jgi:hypothetical protein